MTVPGNSGDDIRASERDFEDVLAFLRTLEAPKYPLPVDAALASEGEVIFEGVCADCHGHYGSSPSYPNEVVPVDKIGTDPARNAFMHDLGFAEHYAKSWYGENSKMGATKGYLAPPLDGIWATAPYLHNASVPTLDAVLDPALRPTYFIRSRDSRDYDLERVGWRYETLQTPDDKRKAATFDTTRYGKGNGGHTFAVKLSASERRAVLEYLKTL
jgi:mono/diheme cytochrome c family protein